VKSTFCFPIYQRQAAKNALMLGSKQKRAFAVLGVLAALRYKKFLAS
jgi:hypothetical protein